MGSKTAHLFMLKKLIICLFVFSSCFTHANVIGRVFRVSTIIDLSEFNHGNYIAVTGFGGSSLETGDLDINSNGEFTSKSIYTEVRKYNPVANELGPKITNDDATNISWSLLSEPIVKKNNMVTTEGSAIVIANGKKVNVSDVLEGKPNQFNNVSWNVHSKDKFSNIKPGDEIEISTAVMVSVTF